MYRVRTADKGRPLIISQRVIDDYSEGTVDTLHKKNLLHLGEDRFLTTIMMKHFPTFKMKFTPDAVAHTIAPDKFEILLSQRRRWINSTVHNLCELVFLSDLCGFCCFSMRFVVFIDLVGTVVLPATVVYVSCLCLQSNLANSPQSGCLSHCPCRYDQRTHPLHFNWYDRRCLCPPSHHLPPEEGVHAHRMDDHLYYGVRLRDLAYY